MNICPKCNSSYTDDKKFCKKCGIPLISEYCIEPKELAKKTVFEDRLKIDPLNLEILHEYAQFLFNNSLSIEAIVVLLKILTLNEKDGMAKDMLFKSYHNLTCSKKLPMQENNFLKKSLMIFR
jgi:predicted amidophosphoribosyltransferase